MGHLFFVLGIATDHRTGMDDIACTNAGVLDHRGVMMNDTVVANGHIGANKNPGADLDPVTYFCTRIYDSRRMYQCGLLIERQQA